MSVPRTYWLQTAAFALGFVPACCTLAFSPVPDLGTPVPGTGRLPATEVWGKEYSHDIDITGGPGAPVADPEQVIRWDGSGGTANGVDYSGSRPNYPQDRQVDALANTRDALFNELLRDGAGLAFSHDDEIYGFTGGGLGPITVPSGGPLTTASGLTIGGAGELSMEFAGAFAGPAEFGMWATQPEIDSRFDPLTERRIPRDVDGVEVWGSEPDQGNDFRGDADKYSLEIDAEFGFSVWNASGSPYLPHMDIVTAVEALLGPAPDEAFLPYDEVRGRNAINVDALMVQDVIGSPQQFDREFERLDGAVRDQEGQPIELEQQGDSLIFSIRQMVMPDGSYYATGSELFVLDSLGGVSFLKHGEHLWDSAFAMSELTIEETFFEETNQEVRFAVLDINAIEAIGDLEIDPPVLRGDYNFDGKVDAIDYAVWRDAKGSMGAGLPADGNGDGVIDDADRTIWANNYGAMAMSPATATGAAIPEPTTVLLAGLAIAGVATARRRG